MQKKRYLEFSKIITEIRIQKMDTIILTAIVNILPKYLIKFDINDGISCSCGFNSNLEELKSKHNKE